MEVVRVARATKRAEGEAGSTEAQSPNRDIGRWIVWGTGEPVDIVGAQAASGVAMEMAAENDRFWARRPDRWAVTVDGEESAVESLVAELPGALGFAPYLAAGRSEDVPPEPMKGTLRSDVAPRRKAEPR